MIIGAGLDARLGLRFPELRDVAGHARQLGFESLWTPAGTVPDAFHVCGAWSQDTGLRTGISVVPAARIWHPVSLAIQAATLAQLSGGQFVLGIGTGGAGPAFWESLGLDNKPIAYMREYTTAVRQLAAGQTVTLDGQFVHLRQASLGLAHPAPAPVYLGALGDQMVRLAGEVADGVLLNWASPERIGYSRALVAQGARRAGRDPAEVATTMYIRVCVDEDEAAARQAFGANMLGYAMAQPGVPAVAGYRGLFTEMGFDDVLSDLEARRANGASVAELVDAAPDELLRSVGYYGPARDAAAAYAKLTVGLDETIVRIIIARPGPEAVVDALTALTPAAIRAAPAS